MEVFDTISPTGYASDQNYYIAVVIYDVDQVNRNYTTDFVFKDSGTSKWTRLYPNPYTWSFNVIEESNPYLIDHVEISQIGTEFPTKVAFDTYIGKKSKVL